jgi:nitrate reductase beta subunit
MEQRNEREINKRTRNKIKVEKVKIKVKIESMLLTERKVREKNPKRKKIKGENIKQMKEIMFLLLLLPLCEKILNIF